ncbi:MAG TPA: class I tRNA ligase family protein [Anaerolineales bacterium]|nr:class I tRNA ligase family protein [Anaerolineales bacterium]
MFDPVPQPVDFVQQEYAILRFWEETGAFETLRRLRRDAPTWSFIDGPITANNPMGVHHGWGRTYKDLFQRFKAMQGYRTRYQNGFDCQGLWVEVNVEKDMGFRSKRDIEAYGLAEFVLLCKQRVLTYAAVQTQQSIRLGYWMDWNRPKDLEALRDRLAENPAQIVTLEGPSGPVAGTAEAIVGRLGLPELGGSYFTFSDENNYTIWHMLRSCHDRGWIYKGHDVMPWCARCGTGLSQHEIVTEGYQELTHPSITLRFPLRDRPRESLLVWTTTPWTLSSNVAAAVGPDLDYVQVRQGDESFYLSRGTLHMLQGPYEVVRELKGSAMEGWAYRGPFDELPAVQAAGVPAAHRVILWDEVGEEEGTGIVHIAPGCGAEDFALSKIHHLPVLAPIDEAGVFLQGFGWLTGQVAGDVPRRVYEDLEQKGVAYRLKDYTHRYPVCWRCSSELVFRLVDEWFISMGAPYDRPVAEASEDEKARDLRLQLMEVVEQETDWHPDFGKDRELDWLRNMHDWMISKKRYWGLALPIWECAACGHFEVIGSREELQARAVAGWATFEGHSPHRPYIDAVEIECTRCGARVHRIPDVGNPWLDAGIVAMSTLQYRTDRAFWSQWFPADLISESFPGQFRNWFYSLLAMSTILERKAPFRHVFSYATLLAEDGRPMHKSAGNMVEFNEAADRMGVDVMRWLYCDHRPEKDLLFGYHRADEVRRQFLLPLWNAYSFFVTYARLDGWKPGSPGASTPSVLDRWIRARMGETVREVTASLERYEPDSATASVDRFLDHLTNWYLRRSRRRFWTRSGSSPAADADKRAAYATLYEVLETLCRLLAPFVPFVTEVMYQNLVRTQDPQAAESVHHTHWPETAPSMEDEALLGEMSLVLKLASLGHAARNAAGRKLRQPLAEAVFSVPSAPERSVVEAHASLLADELNVKRIRLLEAATEAVEFRLNPLPKQLGQKYGSRFPRVREAILRLEAAPAAAGLNEGKPIEVSVDGETLTILPEEIEVRAEARAGLGTAADGGYVAGVVVALTPELEAEGLAREFIRRLQDLRKQAGLDIADRIAVQFDATPRLAQALEAFSETVAGETLAVTLVAQPSPSGEAAAEFSFEGESARVALRRA